MVTVQLQANCAILQNKTNKFGVNITLQYSKTFEMSAYV